MKDSEFGVEVTTSPFDGMRDGDKISDWMDRREDGASIRELLEVISDRTFTAMDSYRKENNEDMPPHATAFYSGGVAFISPNKLGCVEEKDLFFDITSKIIYKVAEDFKDQPIVVTFASTAWSCFLRKEHAEDLEKMCTENKIPISAQELKIALVEQVVKEHGSMEHIPSDHPFVLKMEVMVFTFHFLSMDGPICISQFRPVNHGDAKMIEDCHFPLFNTFRVDKHCGHNRVNFDVSNYEPVNFKDSDFEDQD